VILNDEQTQAAYYCVAALVRSRQRGGQPIPAWLHRHYSQLDTVVRGSAPRGASVAGNADGASHSQDAVIGTTETAEMLSLTPRQVRRRADQLGGRLIGDRWLFSPQNVADYAARGGR
jgi:hypothetical protein